MIANTIYKGILLLVSRFLYRKIWENNITNYISLLTRFEKGTPYINLAILHT